MSSHDLIEINYNITIERIQRRTITIRDFSFCDVNKFLCNLSNRDWNRLLSTYDIDFKVSLLNQYLLACLDNNALLKIIQPKHVPAPWLTVDIKARISERDRARRRWRRGKSEVNCAQYKVLRNEVQIVRRAKEEYNLATFSKLKNPEFGSLSLEKVSWKELRKLGLVKTKSEFTLPFTTNELNHYFSDCSSLSTVDDEASSVNIGESFLTTANYIGKILTLWMSSTL